MPIEKLSAKISRRALLRGTATGAAGLGAMAMFGSAAAARRQRRHHVTIASGTTLRTQAAASPTAAAPTEAAWTRVQLAAAPRTAARPQRRAERR